MVRKLRLHYFRYELALKDHSLELLMAKPEYSNWLQEREEWEGDRAIYELELQAAFEKASDRRTRFLMAAFACHVVTTTLVTGWQVFVGFALAIAAAAILLRLHSVENTAARMEMKEKVELKFPENLTPGPPEQR